MQARSEVEPLRASENARVGVHLLHKISDSSFSRADDLTSEGRTPLGAVVDWCYQPEAKRFLEEMGSRFIHTEFYDQAWRR
jgi:hypothetical protein